MMPRYERFAALLLAVLMLFSLLPAQALAEESSSADSDPSMTAVTKPAPEPDPEPEPNNGAGNGQTVLYITYKPEHHFHGAAPSKDELVEAERISQDEFSRMMDRWMRDNARKKF